MDKIKLTIRLNPDTHSALKALSEREGQPIQWLAERALDNYLTARKA